MAGGGCSTQSLRKYTKNDNTYTNIDAVVFWSGSGLGILSTYPPPYI
jgi:hypothetical protein